MTALRFCKDTLQVTLIMIYSMSIEGRKEIENA